MKNDDVVELATRIARDLFTDGNGDRASRLVMEYPGQSIPSGGWSEEAMRDRIADMIRSLRS